MDECKNDLIDERHYVLYAKGYYERSENLLEDLREIHAVWAGLNKVDIETNDIYNVINKLVFDYYINEKDKNSFDRYSKVVNSFFVSGGYVQRLIERLLNYLTISKFYKEELGCADRLILPLKKKARNNYQYWKDMN